MDRKTRDAAERHIRAYMQARLAQRIAGEKDRKTGKWADARQKAYSKMIGLMREVDPDFHPASLFADVSWDQCGPLLVALWLEKLGEDVTDE